MAKMRLRGHISGEMMTEPLGALLVHVVRPRLLLMKVDISGEILVTSHCSRWRGEMMTRKSWYKIKMNKIHASNRFEGCIYTRA